MAQEYMLPVDVLNRMDDLSAATLYQSEVRRISLLSREEQAPYIDAARQGNTEAQYALINNCLNWTMRQARTIQDNDSPKHTDLMDLVGQANLKMWEAMPKALNANDPIAYLMSVSATEMHRYCLYADPLIKRQRDQPFTKPHPTTVSLEANDAIPTEQSPADEPQLRLVYKALGSLSARHRTVLTAAYGLNGETAHKNEDIATMLHLPKETVEKYLWRAKKRLAAKLGAYAGELGLRAS
jgi:RNA polymerase sigma factor (sigma-70 family)